jgi:hypothetical protein
MFRAFVATIIESAMLWKARDCPTGNGPPNLPPGLDARLALAHGAAIRIKRMAGER